jgi:DNA-cytosine methyltransferase
MLKPTITTLFAGIGGVDRGAITAGYEPCESVEFDPQIAELHKANIGGKMHVKNILDCDPRRFEKVDLLHASPVCKSYSSANTNKGEQQLDIDCAIKTSEFIAVLEPPIFTLENVQAYEKSKAFSIILEKLYSLGYWVNYQVLNAADFGVPQSRRRLILVALKRNLISDSDIIQSGDIRLVKNSLEKGSLINVNQLILFDTPKSLAFEFDRIPDFNDSSLKYLFKQGFYAVIVNNKFVMIKGESVPSLPAKERHIGWYEAIKDKVHNLPDSDLAAWQWKALPKDILDHCFLDAGNSSDPTFREANLPCGTIAAQPFNDYKALLIENTGARSDRGLQTRAADEPCWTLRAMGQDGHYHRANALLENAKIKALDIPCLARLQSFPDNYIWSGVKSVDGKGIGNSVCPLKYQKIIERLC